MKIPLLVLRIRIHKLDVALIPVAAKDLANAFYFTIMKLTLPVGFCVFAKPYVPDPDQDEYRGNKYEPRC